MNVKAVSSFSFGNTNSEKKTQKSVLPAIITAAALSAIAVKSCDTFVRSTKPDLSLSSISKLSEEDKQELKMQIEELNDKGIWSLSNDELKILGSVEKRVGEYYDVDYNKDTKTIILTCGDISKNECIPETGCFKYDMMDLKCKLGLKAGVLKDNNPELVYLAEDMRSGRIEYRTLDEALENGDAFYYDRHPGFKYAIDYAISLPGNQLFIPIDEIDKKNY